MKITLPRKTLTLWRLRLCAAAALLLAASLLLCIFSVYFLLLSGAVLLLFALAVFWYLPRFFSGCIITVTAEAVTFERGVIIRTTHILPALRMVYATGFSTPLARQMGLTAVILRAARAALIIPELSAEDASGLIRSVGRKSCD